MRVDEARGGAARRAGWSVPLAAMALMAACGEGGAERPSAADSLPAADPARVEVSVFAPDSLGWNQRDSVRVVVANRTARPLAGGELRVTVDGAPLVLREDTPSAALRRPLRPLPPGAAESLAFPIRIPPAPLDPPGETRYLLRLEVAAAAFRGEHVVHVRPGSEAVPGGCATASGAAVQRYGIGPVRVRMPADALRAACPEARDTALEGGAPGAAALRVHPGGVPILAEVARDTVRRVHVHDPRPRTAVGLGVGSTLAELRSRYGPACPAAGRGRVEVGFEAAPGISFRLDSLGTREWLLAGAEPGALPDTARVDALAIHGQPHRCPPNRATP